MKKYNEILGVILKGDSEKIKEYSFSDLSINKKLWKYCYGFLYFSIRYHRNDIFYYLEGIGLDINEKNYWGLSLLSEACSFGNIEIAKYLYKKGFNINEFGQYYNSLELSISSKGDNINTIKFLIENGIDITRKNHRSLILACYHNNTEVIKLLVLAGANVNEKRDEYVPICHCIKHNNIEMIKFLISNGANILFEDKNIREKLFKAIIKVSNDEIFEIFDGAWQTYDIGINFNKYLCYCSKKTIDRVLLILGGVFVADDETFKEINYYLSIFGPMSDINHCWSYDKTRQPRYKKMLKKFIGNILYTHRRTECLRNYRGSFIWLLTIFDVSLFDFCLGISSEINFSDKNLINIIHTAEYYGNIRTIEEFVKIGYDIPGDISALSYACMKNRFEMVKYLVGNGAGVNTKNRHEITPIFYASFYGYYDIFEYLIDNGADINLKTPFGNTLLHTVILGFIHSKSLKIFDYLLDTKFIGINEKNKDGNTPLACAYRHYTTESKEMIDKLISAGADVNISDEDGKTIFSNYFSPYYIEER